MTIIPVSELSPGDIICYSTSVDMPSDEFTAIVVTICDDSLSLIDIHSTNISYIVPQGYTYNDYQTTIEEKNLFITKKLGTIDLIGYIEKQIPEYFI